MKKKSVPLIILSVFLLIGAIECFIFSAMYQEKTTEIDNIADVYISDVNDYATIYFENLQVLQRYAFKTMREYNDIDSGYTDVTYYVYDDSQPMDKNELSAQYYIVKFSDKSGNEYITSISVSASKDISSALTNCPQTINVCAGVSPIADRKLLNSNDEELIALRESALDAYSQQTQIPRANITLGYQTESIAQNLEAQEKDVSSAKTTAGITGVVLAVVAVVLLTRSKKGSAAKKQSGSQEKP